MVERHTHVWVKDNTPELLSYGLIRVEETCSCGATRIRVGYGYLDRRR